LGLTGFSAAGGISVDVSIGIGIGIGIGRQAYGRSDALS